MMNTTPQDPKPQNRSASQLHQWFHRTVDWDDAVLPDYWGGSIANLGSSILDSFGIEPAMNNPILPPVNNEKLPADVISGARVLMTIVIDGLSEAALRRYQAQGVAPGLANAHHHSTLTSVFPSTTAAALTSIQTGTAPGTHGMAGYTLYLPETGQVQNMITWKAVQNGNRGRAKTAKLERFLPVSPIFQHFVASDVETVVVTKAEFQETSLTRLHLGTASFRGYQTLADLPERLMREVERPGKRFVSGYWGGFDTLGHSYGPDSRAVQLEFELIDHVLRAGLLEPLQESGEDVAVIVTADHGHVPLPQASRLHLDSFGVRARDMKHRPTGEIRATGLELRNPGGDREKLARGIGDAGVVLDTDAAIQAGLYGPGPDHEELLQRVGNTLVLGRGETAFTYANFNSGVIGGHGSLSAEEMTVPLLVWRFGR